MSGAPDAGSSSSHAVGAPVNTPSRARDGAAHPPSSGMSSLSRRVRLLPQSAGVTADDAFPAFAGLTPVLGVVRKRLLRRITQQDAWGRSPRIAVRDGKPRRGRSACPSYLRGGRASPPHHDRQPWCDAGPGAPGPPRTIRMDGGIRRFGDARPTARWCNGSTPALWREVRVRIPRRAPTPIRSALRRSHKGRGGCARPPPPPPPPAANP